MDDLQKKKQTQKNDYYVPGAIPMDINKPGTSELFYDKLSAYLLLLYQLYLRREAVLEPEIKTAIWRMVQFNTTFPDKIRMLQLDYLQKEPEGLGASWEDAREALFPIDEITQVKPVNTELESSIKEYKEVVAELLALHP